MGALAVVVGYVGLRGVYRRRRDSQPESFTPPVRRIAPIAAPPPADAPTAKETDVTDDASSTESREEV